MHSFLPFFFPNQTKKHNGQPLQRLKEKEVDIQTQVGPAVYEESIIAPTSGVKKERHNALERGSLAQLQQSAGQYCKSSQAKPSLEPMQELTGNARVHRHQTRKEMAQAMQPMGHIGQITTKKIDGTPEGTGCGTGGK